MSTSKGVDLLMIRIATEEYVFEEWSLDEEPEAKAVEALWRYNEHHGLPPVPQVGPTGAAGRNTRLDNPARDAKIRGRGDSLSDEN